MTSPRPSPSRGGGLFTVTLLFLLQIIHYHQAHFYQFETFGFKPGAPSPSPSRGGSGRGHHLCCKTVPIKTFIHSLKLLDSNWCSFSLPFKGRARERSFYPARERSFYPAGERSFYPAGERSLKIFSTPRNLFDFSFVNRDITNSYSYVKTTKL